MAEIQLKALEDFMQYLQSVKPEDLGSAEDIRLHLISLTSWLAWSGEQMAVTGRAYNIAKRDAYHKLQQDFEANGAKLSPMLARDYVNSLCSKEGYAYDLAERSNRSTVHAIDALRSVLSSLKEEQRSINYAA